MQTWTDNDKPLLYILDKDFNFVHLEEHYSSLVWTERYQEFGDFVLDIPLNKVNYKNYGEGYYLCFTDSEETMIIESVEIQHEYEQPQLEISGRSLTSILERRVNASKALDLNLGKIKYIGLLGDVVSSIVSDEITNPYVEEYEFYHLELDDGKLVEVPGPGSQVEGMEETTYLKRSKLSQPSRVIPNFKYTNLVDGSVTIDKRFDEIKTVYDLLNIFSKKTVTGFKILLDISDNFSFNLVTYKGTDRTTKQNVLNPIIFSTMLDNVAYVKYFEDHTDYKNVILSYTSDDKEVVRELNGDFGVLGEIGDNDAGETTYLWCGNEDEDNAGLYAAGLDRYEVAVKSNANVSSIESSSTSSQYSSTPYIAGEVESDDEEASLSEKLKITADESFDDGDYDIVKTTEGSIDPLVRYRFNEDYFLGDTIEFFDEIGIHVIALIDEVVRSYDQEGYIVTPNFKTMYDYEYGEEGDPDDENDSV